MLLHNKFLVLFVFLVALGPLHATDTDGDGVLDLVDNCSEVANADQRNTDGDAFGNICDPDFNNDGQVNFPDLAAMEQVFFLSGNFPQDMNGDGQVSFPDLVLLSEYFFTAPGPAGGLSRGLQVVPAFTSISIDGPIAMKQAPGDDSSWYVAERNGRILRFDNVATPGQPDVVLDIVSKVDTFFEGGLLDFAFDPDFAGNGRLFVSYTADGSSSQSNPLDSRISLFRPSQVDPDTFDADAEIVIIEIDQPQGNHNGGSLAFGHDGMLYLGLGDGGGSNDTGNNSQNITNLLGTIIRIDVNLTDEELDLGLTYRIPDGNAFPGSASCATGCPETYAYGLRNPWRFSFDSLTGELYAGDVGQSTREEIDLIVAGGNYGWRCYEGNLSFNLSGCGPATDYLFPLVDYGRSEGASVTGGYVYRGSDYPDLQGVYLYSDYISGKIWGLLGGKELGELVDTPVDVASFAQGNDGELYLLQLFPSAIYRVQVVP